MQWILQRGHTDSERLGAVLEALGLQHSFERMAPFIGDIDPVPQIDNPANTIIFGLHSTRNFARKHGLYPGIIELRPHIQEVAWQDFLLNPLKTTIFATAAEIVSRLADDPRDLFFVRAFDDTKALAGQVLTKEQIEATVAVTSILTKEEFFAESLNPTTELMVSSPVDIVAEWRLWIVDDKVATYSRYKQGDAVRWTYAIDDDVIPLADSLIAKNPGYAPAYVMDICRTDEGLKLLETNSINSAGLYKGNLTDLVQTLEEKFTS
ncbi:ATP-grasp domain-containing protein [Rhizobium sp. MHM7A]|uniref:ATP-grasp domain-containing protein n=1 Tax=Rhizobium sp. MHM7A TaxID=2583233 RepID=UPI00148743D4|nr:ATP-grasp domain-containing protein [Rhizobium sp. MHM7A]